MKFSHLLPLVLCPSLSACGSTSFDKPPYSDVQAGQIRRAYYYFHALDKRMAQDLHLADRQLGYVANDGSFYFRKCLPAGKTFYLGVDSCNYQAYLGAQRYKQLLSTITSLRKLRIRSTFHSNTGKLYFQIDNEYQQYGDGRLLALEDSVDHNLLSQWQLLDKKSGILLLGDRDRPQQ